MEQIYERNCPECGKKMIYKSENSLYQGEYRKSKCYKCAFKDTHKNSHNKISQDDAENIISDICKDKNYEFIGFLNGEFIGCRKSRLILKCNIDNNVWDVLYDNFVNKKSGCPKCGIELSKKTKQLKNKKTKIRNLNDGNNYSCSLETRLKRQKSMLGRKVSDETRKKQRISRIKNIEEKKEMFDKIINEIEECDKLLEEMLLNIVNC